MMALLIAAPLAWGQIPQTIAYQGVLTDASGTVVADGNYSLTFKLYEAASGGSVIWTETQTVAVSNGVFAAILGSVTPLTPAFDKQYWLGISVGGGSELSPRTQLTSAAYSLNTRSLVDGIVTTNKLADDAVTTAKLDDDAVTRDKIANNAVNSARIADGTIITEDVADNAITGGKNRRWAGCEIAEHPQRQRHTCRRLERDDHSEWQYIDHRRNRHWRRNDLRCDRRNRFDRRRNKWKRYTRHCQWRSEHNPACG